MESSFDINPYFVHRWRILMAQLLPERPTTCLACATLVHLPELASFPLLSLELTISLLSSMRMLQAQNVISGNLQNLRCVKCGELRADHLATHPPHLWPVTARVPLVLDVFPMRHLFVRCFPVLPGWSSSKSVRITFNIQRNVLPPAGVCLRLREP